ncbi:MAG: hypothetical protein ND895_00790, partial [Pyrinomonadaceae bacterium]|nr:hypothetical protein [Pyrinomonadaceae bacterium]
MNTQRTSSKVATMERTWIDARSFGVRLRAKNWIRPGFAAVALLTLLSSPVTHVYAQGTWSFTGSMDETHFNLQRATRLKNG